MSHIGWEGEQTTIYKGVETFPYQTCFKALKGSPNEKTQRGQYLLAVDLERYKWYQSQTLDNVSTFLLFPGGVDMRRCVSKDAGPKKDKILPGISLPPSTSPSANLQASLMHRALHNVWIMSSNAVPDTLEIDHPRFCKL